MKHDTSAIDLEVALRLAQLDRRTDGEKEKR